MGVPKASLWDDATDLWRWPTSTRNLHRRSSYVETAEPSNPKAQETEEPSNPKAQETEEPSNPKAQETEEPSNPKAHGPRPFSHGLST